MNYPALKGEVSYKEKMLSQTNPRLRRNDVMFHSFASCVTDASEKLSRTPKVSFSEILSQPDMFAQKHVGRITLKQLQCLANTHRRRQLNKKMDVVNSDVQLVDFTPIFPSSSVENSFAVCSNTKELEWVSGIFRFPDKMESVLSERMFSGLKFHFFAPAKPAGNKAHANFAKFNSGGATAPSFYNNFTQLNIGDGNSSLGLNAEVSLPLM